MDRPLRSLSIFSCELANEEGKLRISELSKRGAPILALLALLGCSYVFVIRPGQLRWGATVEEVARAMPEDGIVAHPVFDATRAITIRGTPEAIWPWLVQMGFKRAGFYGYDLIENLGNGSGIRSAGEILPAYQHPQTGDLLPISVAATLVFGSIKPNSYIVWRSRDVPSDGVYIWELVPVDAGHTRLISRIRWRYAPGALMKALGLFTEFFDHVAVRRILEGIRDRVEGRTPEPLSLQALEITACLLAFLELCTALVFVARWRRWKLAWFIAMGAGVLVTVVLYSGAPVWLSAPLPWIYLAVMLWSRRSELCGNADPSTAFDAKCA
jgi:hypothetical protein